MKKILFILTAIIMLFMVGCTSEPDMTESQEPQSQYDILSDEETSNYMNEKTKTQILLYQLTEHS